MNNLPMLIFTPTFLGRVSKLLMDNSMVLVGGSCMGSLGSRDASGGKGNIYFLIDIVVSGISLSCDILLPS